MIRLFCVRMITILFAVCAMFQNVTGYKFAVVPKDLTNVFFTDVGRGCNESARVLSSNGVAVECLFVGSPTGDKRYRQGNQTEIVENLLQNNDLDGMAIAVIDEEEATRLINKSLSMGIPAITFNVDAPKSDRMAYVGSDNKAYGEEIANTLLQTKPEGGKYFIVDRNSVVIKIISNAARNVLNQQGTWTEVTEPLDCGGKGNIAHQLMNDTIEDFPKVDAIVCVGSYAVREEHINGWKTLVNDPKFKDVKFIVATERREAIDLLKEGYIDSLIGAQPYMMGVDSINHLLELRRAQDNLETAPFPNGTIFNTPLISFLAIDTYLQNPTIDYNYIGESVVLGYVCFGIILFVSLILLTLVAVYRNNPVMKKSQPFFLYMILAGAVIFGSAILPMGFDTEKYTEQECSNACMIMPWLFTTGFTTMYSAFFAKTWRINQVMAAAVGMQRVKIRERDVMVPFSVITLANTIVLLCWTIVSPIKFTVSPSKGTDHWNRTYKSFHGSCYTSIGKNRSAPFMITLFVIFLGVVLISNREAYKARKIQTEYAESRYIAIAMGSMIQALVVVIPLLMLLDQNPRERYLLAVFFIFIVDMATLLLLFIPKCIALQKQLKEKNPDFASGLHIVRFAFKDSTTRNSTAS